MILKTNTRITKPPGTEMDGSFQAALAELSQPSRSLESPFRLEKFPAK